MNHWKQTEATDTVLSLDDPGGWWDARVRFDGCVDLRRFHNTPKNSSEDGDVDCLHICDIDDFILRLQALRTLAQQGFSDEFPTAD